MPVNNQNHHIVYFAGCSLDDDPDTIDYVKVGRTTNLGTRFSTMQTGCPHEVFEIGIIHCESRDEMLRTEQHYQTMFKPHHHRAEWYHAGTRVLRIIERDAISSSDNSLDDEARAEHIEEAPVDPDDFMSPEWFNAQLEARGLKYNHVADYMLIHMASVRAWITRESGIPRKRYAQIREFMDVHPVQNEQVHIPSA